MTGRWSTSRLAWIDRSPELEISTVRRTGDARSWTPIWVVRVGDEAFVRSWHRRTTGWFGDAVRTGSAQVRVEDAAVPVSVEDVGSASPGLRAEIDSAYRAKYGAGHRSMVTEDAAHTTLCLRPVAHVHGPPANLP